MTVSSQKVAQPPAVALAQSMFRAQNQIAKESGGTLPELSFRDDKDKWVSLARQTIRVLENQGYTLSKSEPASS
ncbi:hypothetical protein [Shimia sagamensis]|uniref:Uncharacterized protein n=1 Tax=Shimia sagamensis TaxID=1566352 RepID=A0ABY1NC30_9RHOB|nr:hypothetical protein [Shimia sagamensis]SMP05587.1 hypothetical protein SAMN06265373_101579 [Shimia sagamensis]